MNKVRIKQKSKMNKFKLSYVILVTSTVLLPIVALAQGGLGQRPTFVPDTLGNTPTGLQAVFNTLNNIANIMLGVLIAVAVIFIVYGAFLFLTSAGDEAKTKKARGYILYALIAIAIGLAAKGIVAVIIGVGQNV